MTLASCAMTISQYVGYVHSYEKSSSATMMKIDLQSIKNVGKQPSGILISSGSSWLIKPFLMFGLAALFFKVIFRAFVPAGLEQGFVTGAVLLDVAPSTAMVFVWSNLIRGNPAHTLVQVSANDLLILVLFVPMVQFLLGVNGVTTPWDMPVFSIILFVVIPLAGGAFTRFLKEACSTSTRSSFPSSTVSRRWGCCSL